MTAIDETAAWDAVAHRDPARAAGPFVVAVKTTGIFCVPGCPARTPLRKNVSFYATAEEAVDAGFRACKRCRPTER